MHRKSPTKRGRLINFGDLNWFVGAHRTEGLLNFWIKGWEVRTCIPRYLPDTHAHDPEGICYHFPGIGEYLNTSSRWNMVTHKMNQLHFRDIFWYMANCRSIEITIELPSDGWKFGPAMKGNPSVDNELAVGFPRPLFPHQPDFWVIILSRYYNFWRSQCKRHF
jgi:hypothetical protein